MEGEKETLKNNGQGGVNDKSSSKAADPNTKAHNDSPGKLQSIHIKEEPIDVTEYFESSNVSDSTDNSGRVIGMITVKQEPLEVTRPSSTESSGASKDWSEISQTAGGSWQKDGRTELAPSNGSSDYDEEDEDILNELEDDDSDDEIWEDREGGLHHSPVRRDFPSNDNRRLRGNIQRPMLKARRQMPNITSENINLTCTQCDKTFDKEAHWQMHMRIHVLQNEIGGTSGKSRDEEHIGGDKLYEWSLRQKPSVFLNAIDGEEQDIENNSSSHKFKCQLCPLSFEHINQQKAHIAMVHEATKDQSVLETRKVFQCSICAKTFTREATYKYHMAIHRANPYQCAKCCKCFPVEEGLKKHMWVHSEKNKPYQCEVCFKTFATTGTLEKHMQQHVRKPHYCTTCLKTFEHKLDLEMHMLDHNTGQNQYKCPLCHKTYSLPSLVKKHMRIHTGERTFECEVCKKQFIHASSLNSHMERHAKKPWHCEKCNSCFKKKEDLELHNVIHTQGIDEIERPFGCDVCHKFFVSEVHLKDHKRIHKLETEAKFMKYRRRWPNWPYPNSETENEIKSNEEGNSQPSSHSADMLTDSPTPVDKKADNSHKCTLCGKSFDSQVSLADHCVSHSLHIQEVRTLSHAHVKNGEQNKLTEVGAPSKKIDESLRCHESLDLKHQMQEHSVDHESDFPGNLVIKEERPSTPDSIKNVDTTDMSTPPKSTQTSGDEKLTPNTKKQLLLHECPVCLQLFKSTDDLQNHTKMHTSTLKSVVAKPILPAHLDDSQGTNSPKRVLSPVLGQIMTSGKNQAPKQTVVNFRCDKCHKPCATLDDWENHNKKCCKLNTCPHCGDCFPSIKIWQAHIRMCCSEDKNKVSIMHVSSLSNIASNAVKEEPMDESEDGSAESGLQPDSDCSDDEDNLPPHKILYQCLLCQEIFDSLAQLYDHGNVHKPKPLPKPLVPEVRPVSAPVSLNSTSVEEKTKSSGTEDKLDTSSPNGYNSGSGRYSIGSGRGLRDFRLEDSPLLDSETKEYACTHCHKTFPKMSHLQEHSRIHKLQEELGQPYKEWTRRGRKRAPRISKYDTIIHKHNTATASDMVSSNLTVMKDFRCFQCYMLFSSSKYLALHKCADTPPCKPTSYPCNQCYKKFDNEHHLHEHKRIHDLEATVDRLAQSRESNTMKENVHREIENQPAVAKIPEPVTELESPEIELKPIKCPHCPYIFVTHHEMEEHVASNHKLKLPPKKNDGKKTFECQTCNKSFEKEAHWEQHVRIHKLQAQLCTQTGPPPAKRGRKPDPKYDIIFKQ